MLRETLGNDGLEIRHLRKFERGREEFDLGRVDFTERAEARVGDDFEREVAAIDGGDELDLPPFPLVEDRLDGGDFAVTDP